jgi:hypothetical protein
MRWWDSSVGEGGYLDVFLYHIERDILQCFNSPVYATCVTRMKDDSDGGLTLPILYCTLAESTGRLHPDEPGRPHRCENGSS